MGHVTYTVTPLEYLIETPRIVKIGSMEGQPAGGITWHLLKKINSVNIVNIPDASPDSITLVQQ
jgi:hypothetical protein